MVLANPFLNELGMTNAAGKMILDRYRSGIYPGYPVPLQ